MASGEAVTITERNIWGSRQRSTDEVKTVKMHSPDRVDKTLVQGSLSLEYMRL